MAVELDLEANILESGVVDVLVHKELVLAGMVSGLVDMGLAMVGMVLVELAVVDMVLAELVVVDTVLVGMVWEE